MTTHRTMATVFAVALLGGCGPAVVPATPRAQAVGPKWFEDVTDRVGVRFTHDPGPVPGNFSLPQINGSGCAIADFDGDGDGRPDLLFLTHGGPDSASKNALYRQNDDGTFADVSAGSGLDFAGRNMGVAVGDIDNDGRPDVAVTRYGGVRLFRNLGGMRFEDISESAGVGSRGWCTSAGFLDYDRDGRLDSAVVNGRVNRGPPANDALGPFWTRYAERNQVFVGVGEGKFRDRADAEPDLCGTPDNARGLAVGDLDGDGALDLVVTTINDRARIYRNVCPERGHWAAMRCVDPARGASDVAALVKLTFGGMSRVRLADRGGSFLSSSDARAHFGMGEVKTIDAIEVRWPDGTREAFAGGPADRVITVRKGEGQVVRTG